MAHTLPISAGGPDSCRPFLMVVAALGLWRWCFCCLPKRTTSQPQASRCLWPHVALLSAKAKHQCTQIPIAAFDTLSEVTQLWDMSPQSTTAVAQRRHMSCRACIRPDRQCRWGFALIHQACPVGCLNALATAGTRLLDYAMRTTSTTTA